MKKSTLLYLIGCSFAAVMVIQSCSKDDDKEEETPQPTEFVASDATFADYKSWSVRATSMGPDPAIGTLHGGNDSSVTRTIYVKDGQKVVNGSFPQGTVIVKVSENPSGSVKEYTGMVKRGGNFNSKHNGWEWLVLNEDGTIFTDGNSNQIRGGELFDCHSCHEFAPSDYVYSEP